MSDTSSESEKEFQAKEALKEAPKDDEEVERHETAEIDKGFTSSEDEDEELTEAGKELKALMERKQGKGEDEEELDKPDSDAPPPPPSRAKSSTPVLVAAAEPFDTTAIEDDNEAKADVVEREAEYKKEKGDIDKKEMSKPQKRAADEDTSVPSSAKKPKLETITEEEVRRYLERKPITTKELFKKFSSKKPDMDKKKIVNILGDMIRRMKDVEQVQIKGTLYLSLKTPDQPPPA